MFYLQANVKTEIRVLKIATTFTMKCMNVIAIMDLSSVTTATVALVSKTFPTLKTFSLVLQTLLNHV